ncbi:RidA family protein [Hymenobacter swuensis]|uniref:Endoribonuclease L-PSP n=1 Tax=Hymenobacter swuensis DY53 TaxID=1227739 RepID=W8EZM9_9BACT|nr:RidA family protein [Hymenobacter swuensis]AHJ98093.1 endoribonuclease L-PSP [Hymenobacter swuensis DY53]
MEKRTVDPWKWGERTNSVQAIDIRQPAGTLYCSGLVALDAEGQPSTADMRNQLLQTFRNLEQLIQEAEYECRGIVRLNVYTTSVAEFFTTCTDVYQEWITRHGVKQATTLLEVKGLFAGLTVEVEATVVK